MELMRPLLLFTLAALLPQSLGKSALELKSGNNFDKVILKTDKFNETFNKNKVSSLQSVFMDPTCKGCHSCMELAIKAHKVHFHVSTQNKVNDIPNEIDNPEVNSTQRNKRNLDEDLDQKVMKKGSKKSKGKKNKKNKSFSVIKYSSDDKIYALKVKEATTPPSANQSQSKASVNKCQVYKVNESYSCDTVDADLILNEAKRKTNKQIKEQERKETNLSAEKQEKDKTVPLLIKHHVEDSQMSENFMPSIEEMY